MNDYIQQIDQIFMNRVVKNWNTLPKTVVGAGSLNIFNNSLDRLWSNRVFFSKIYKEISYDVEFSKFLLNIL